MPVVYNPTPEEIEAACEQIQSGWTESDRRSRREGWACLFKHDALGIEHAARFEVDEKLAKKRERLRQAKR